MQLNSTVEPLITLLEQETALYRSMQTVIDQEKEAAVRSDLNALIETRLEKEKCLAEIQKMEVKRRQLVQDLAQDLGCAVNDLKLSIISQLVDEPLAGHLRLASKDLSDVLGRLQDSNRRNEQICAHSLALLRGSFNLLNGLLAPNTVYYRTGNIQSKKATGNCVCDEI
jgi:flagellar biosynthesis/type III secretory pathway chaperone